jgi:hypothetical protein
MAAALLLFAAETAGPDAAIGDSAPEMTFKRRDAGPPVTGGSSVRGRFPLLAVIDAG